MRIPSPTPVDLIEATALAQEVIPVAILTQRADSGTNKPRLSLLGHKRHRQSAQRHGRKSLVIIG